MYSTSKQLQRLPIGLAAKIFLQHVLEYPIPCTSPGKQSHRRPQLQIIRIAKNLLNRPSFNRSHKQTAFHKARPQNRML